MEKTFFDDNRIAFFTDDGKNCIVFEVDDNGEARLVYNDIPDLHEDTLERLFKQALTQQQLTYSGIKLGFIDSDERNFKEVLEQHGIRWNNDIDDSKLYVIIGGSSFTEYDIANMERLQERWQKAEIITAYNIEKYILGQKINCQIDQILHPLLEYFHFDEDKNCFIWPYAGFYPSRALLNPTNFKHEHGVLGVMGYSVGEKHASLASERRDILSKAYEKNIPFVNSAEYMLEWGASGTAQRLAKIANSLAAFARSFQSRNGSDKIDDCINKWAQDLQWLKEKYYDGNYDRVGRNYFPWPSITGGFYYGY